MESRRWTDKEVKLLKRKVRFDERGFVKNTKQLMKIFGRRDYQIQNKVCLLRKNGELPTIYYDDPIQPIMQPFRDREDRFIVKAVNAGASAAEVAESLNRTKSSIHNRISFLRKNRPVQYTQKRWTKSDDAALLECIRFDEFGYCANIHELMRATGRTQQAVYCRIYKLRKKDLITTLPDKKRSPISWKTRETGQSNLKLCFISKKRAYTSSR